MEDGGRDWPLARALPGGGSWPGKGQGRAVEQLKTLPGGSVMAGPAHGAAGSMEDRYRQSVSVVRG